MSIGKANFSGTGNVSQLEQGRPSEFRETCWCVLLAEFMLFLLSSACKPVRAHTQIL